MALPELGVQVMALPAAPGTDARRFRRAATVAVLATAVPYLWVISSLWNSSPTLLRTAFQNGLESNFYDLQARAMLAGRLSVPAGSLGIEAYVHDGRTYTYFGLFPSLLRLPLLLVTHGLDGRLTALSMLAAWLVTAIFSSLLIWRVRVLARGAVPLARAETVALGAVVAAITGGSVLVFLAANPYVFSEDLAWSVAVTVGSLFALLGVLERPSSGRVVLSGALILAASLTRAPTGYACVIGAFLTSIWFASGRRGTENRRWSAPVLAAGAVPLAIGCAVNMAKFGTPFGLPITSGVAYKVIGGPNGGHEFSLRFLPSTLDAYLKPDGIRLTPVFPFVTLPAQVAEGVGGVSVYGNRTASMTTTMPLLFLLAVWGSISAFRPRQDQMLKAVRLLLVAAAAGAGATLIFGWIYNRYLADFLPLLVIGSAVGAIDIWARLHGRRRRTRVVVACSFVGMALLEIAANTAVAVTPSDTWAPEQTAHYIQVQHRVSDLTGHPLMENVKVGYFLPNWAPADTLFVEGYCESVYISDGEGQPTTTDFGIGWLLVEHGSDKSLCPLLVGEKRLTPVLQSSLVRADAAFSRGVSAYDAVALQLAARRNEAESVPLAPTRSSLIGALGRFVVSLQHVAEAGLPTPSSRALTAALLADCGSLQGDLSESTDQSPETVAGWASHVRAQWMRTTSDYTSLLHELVASADG